MHKTLIGIDFSIAKPAACVFYKNKYYFYSWVKNLSDKNIKIFRDSNIHISKRIDEKNEDLVRNDLINSNILSDLIINDLKKYIDNDTEIIFEGTSFGSTGNMIISLTAWRYILMQKLLCFIDVDHITTFSPITIKKTAGCSKRGMGKKEMIDAFINLSNDNILKKNIKTNPIIFKKRTGTWVDHLDDFVDAYWAIETFKIKNPDKLSI